METSLLDRDGEVLPKPLGIITLLTGRVGKLLSE